MSLTPEEIDGLVERAQRGEQQPFWDLILQVQQDVRVFISILAPSSELVEEILQATLLKAFDILPKYELRGTFVQWLKGIARNLLRQELHSRGRHLSMAGRTLEALVAEACMTDLEKPAIEASEPDAALRECMDRLAPHARELIDRRYGQGLPLNRIAQQFKKPADTICVTLHRIRETLRQCLSAKGSNA